MSVTISTDVLGDLTHYFESLPEVTAEAAALAINQTMKRTGRKRITDEIYSQVAFPKGYLDLPDRLGMVKYAKPQDLEAIMRARHRATSLARFMLGGQSFATSRVAGKVRVQVTPGQIVTLNRAFPIRLNAGAENTETTNNLGLAVRVPKGESLRFGKGYKIESSGNGKTDLFLLYSVSVDQIFRRIADEQLDNIGNDVTSEFMRQFTRLQGS